MGLIGCFLRLLSWTLGESSLGLYGNLANDSEGFVRTVSSHLQDISMLQSWTWLSYLCIDATC